MEDKDLELYLAKAKAADEGISSFSENINNVPVAWEKGDIITFPTTIKGHSFKTKIGTKKYEYIVVHVKSADGSERYANFFPSVFRRRARKCDWDTVDGVDVAIPTNEWVSAGGSIVESLYQKNSKVNDVITKVLGKSIEISELHEVESSKYGTNEQEIVKVYDFEPHGWSLGTYVNFEEVTESATTTTTDAEEAANEA
jgi:hypothetical protein